MQQGVVIAAGEVRAAQGTVEEGITGEHGLFVREVIGDAAGGMAGGVQHGAGHAAEDLLARGQVTALEGRHRREAPDAAVGGFRTDQAGIVDRRVDRGAGLLHQRGHAVHMVEVAVREADGGQRQALGAKIVQDGGGIAAGIDDHGLAVLVDEVTVGLQRTQRIDGIRHGILPFANGIFF